MTEIDDAPVPAKVTVELRGLRQVFDVPDIRNGLTMPRDAIDVTPPGAVSVHRRVGDTVHLSIVADLPAANCSGWEPVNGTGGPVELPEVRILRLQPGDVLVLNSPARLSDAEVDEIRRNVGAVFPGHRMALFEDGMTLDILRKDGD